MATQQSARSLTLQQEQSNDYFFNEKGSFATTSALSSFIIRLLDFN
jgi:hypothetical protein